MRLRRCGCHVMPAQLNFLFYEADVANLFALDEQAVFNRSVCLLLSMLLAMAVVVCIYAFLLLSLCTQQPRRLPALRRLGSVVRLSVSI